MNSCILALVLALISAAVAAPHDDLFLTREGAACGYASCTKAEADMLNVHIVPHTHDDVGWLKTVDQYYYGSQTKYQKAGVQYILDTVVKELWEDPERRFIYVETFFFWKWWTLQPESVRDKVRELVRQGRLQFVGGAWSMNDEAAAHYQATVDQFTWGLSKLNDTFGACGMPRVGWQIDPFGHSREFASLLSEMGYNGLFLGRIDYQDKNVRFKDKSTEMLWRGDDDLGKSSDIFTGVLYNTYSPPKGFCFDVLCGDEPIIDEVTSPMYNVEKRLDSFFKFVSGQAQRYRTDNVIITMGGDFTYQDASMWYTNLDKLIEHGNLIAAQKGKKIKLFYSTPDCYLKAVKDANPTLPTKQDDFFPYASDPHSYWTGYFTSRPTTKYFEREGNNYLQMAKQMQVLADLEEHNIFVLNELKSAMGIFQHHDAITGTEKQHVAYDYERILDKAIEDANIIPRQAFNKFMQGNATAQPILSYDRCHLNESSCPTSENSEQFVVTVYNHLAWSVNDSIRIPVVDGDYDVYAPNADKILSQIVEIPESVTRIPTRKSKATHELVFIAYLHPLSYKSYYITKTHKIDKRDALIDHHKKQNDYHDDMNDYWKRVKEQSLIEATNAEDPTKPRVMKTLSEIPIYDHVGEVKRGDEVKHVNTDMLKDVNEGYSPDIEQLERIISEAKKLIDDTNTPPPRQKPNAMAYPDLNAEEMRMLSDDPMVVERFPDDVILENQYLKLRINGSTGEIITLTLPDGTDLKFGLKFYYYPGWYGDNTNNNRSSGAYIFRPNATSPLEVPMNFTVKAQGQVVKETQGTSEGNVANTIRVYDGLNFVENDWVVGPIDVKDRVGKEYIVKYKTDIVNNGECFTDSNGRQMLKRKLSKRPQWNLTLAEPIAGNYYPVTNKISIEDSSVKLAVFTDRSEGGSSLIEGEIELMLHRRLLHDDAFGVGEALNEVVNGEGLIVRGRHRVFIAKPNDKDSHINEKKHLLQFHLQPQVFVSDAKDLSLQDWLKLKNSFSWTNELPTGIHLLTVEPWKDIHMLLRLENYLELADKADATIEIDLQLIFKTITINKFKETTLAANHWLGDKDHWTWKTEGKFVSNFNQAYGNIEVEEAKDLPKVEDDGFKIKLQAKQIRTFVVDYSIKKGRKSKVSS